MRAADAPFAVVTVLQRQERAFGDLARKYGLAEAMTGTVGIGIPVLALETDRENAIAATIQGSKDCHRRRRRGHHLRLYRHAGICRRSKRGAGRCQGH